MNYFKNVFSDTEFKKFENYNKKFGNKTIYIHEEGTETDEIIDYYKLLMQKNTFLSSYVITKICKLATELEMSDRRKNKGIGTATNYERVQGGYVQSHGDTSSKVERAVLRSTEDEENILHKYEAYVNPAIKLHNSLVEGTKTLLKYNNYYIIAAYSIQKSLPVNSVFDLQRQAVRAYASPQYSGWYRLKNAIKRNDINHNYICIPLFTEKEMQAFKRAKCRCITPTAIKLYELKTGVSEEQIKKMNKTEKVRKIRAFLRPWGGSMVMGYKFMENAMNYAKDPINTVIAASRFEMSAEDLRYEEGTSLQNLNEY